MNSQASTEQSPQSSKSILDEIKKLKESLNSLTSQMADQHKVVQQLKQEVNVLKQNKNEPDVSITCYSLSCYIIRVIGSFFVVETIILTVNSQGF